MSKGQKRSNREIKKPKQPKAKAAAVSSSFSTPQPKLGMGTSAGKKK